MRRAAAQLVQTGEIVSLAHPVSPAPPGSRRGLLLEPHYGRPPAVSGVPWSADTRLTLGGGMTTVVSVSHIGSHERRVYNGREFNAVAGPSGLTKGSVLAQRDGIFTRGVLLDLPAALGVNWVEPDHAITVADLERAERQAGVRVGSGDALVLRVGQAPRLAAAEPGLVLSPGPTGAGIEWLHDREVAIWAGDAPDRVDRRGARLLAGEDIADDPARTWFMFPLHQIALPGMGLVQVEQCSVELLAEQCARLGRYSFLFVMAPLPVSGAASCAVNPLAVF